MNGVLNVFGKLFRFLNGIRKIILNVIFFVLLAVLVGVFMSGEEPVEVPEQSMLVLNLNGILVEEYTWVDPIDKFVNNSLGSSDTIPEVLVSDVLEVLEQAATDDRIGGVYLSLESFLGGGLNKMQTVAAALEEFKTSGKPIYTYADYFSQNQYYLAAHADQVYLNPLGGMMLEGYGAYRLYFSEMLEKLKVTTHVFKVGAYKSAVEPYTRTSMSDEAREANSQVYTALWDAFLADLTQQRDIDPLFLSGRLADFQTLAEAAGNDLAQLTVNAGLVDGLKTREQFRNEMINLTGLDEDEESWKRIDHSAYLVALEQSESAEPVTSAEDQAKVAVVVARGVIMDGYQNPGSIGGDSTAELLREARLDDQVKAVVLRIDSPGGSAFASEVIRQELLELQQAGKPVIASMSSVAASGGYWIAASADEIWASPHTITGSIGVFGMFFTLENSLKEVGVYSDGFHTTEMPMMDLARPIPDGAKQIIQLSIDKIYTDFVSMVAASRNMTYEQVHAVAQGRVWTGAKAQELGLVDRLGDIDDAIAAAASKANLEDYRVEVVERELSGRDKFIADLFGEAQAWLPQRTQTADPIRQQVMQVWQHLGDLSNFNDPNGAYALCELCPIE